MPDDQDCSAAHSITSKKHSLVPLDIVSRRSGDCPKPLSSARTIAEPCLVQKTGSGVPQALYLLLCSGLTLLNDRLWNLGLCQFEFGSVALGRLTLHMVCLSHMGHMSLALGIARCHLSMVGKHYHRTGRLEFRSEMETFFSKTGPCSGSSWTSRRSLIVFVPNFAMLAV